MDGPRPRPATPERRGDEPAIARPGFQEEALPWLDAVYAFSLRLTRGNEDDAADLVQETFLRAHRFWDRYERGTNVKSWLFTICRNVYLRGAELARHRKERPASEFDLELGSLSVRPMFTPLGDDPERAFFHGLIADEVVEAIDQLPDGFREVVVLSDLGDLQYREIADVLEIPVGTVKSRLYRGRNLLQQRLRDFAIRSGYLEEPTP